MIDRRNWPMKAQKNWPISAVICCILIHEFDTADHAVRTSKQSASYASYGDTAFTREGAKYCDEYVCMSVCPSVRSHNSKTIRPNFTKFLCILPIRPWHDPFLAELRYVMKFSFCAWWRHVFHIIFARSYVVKRSSNVLWINLLISKDQISKTRQNKYRKLLAQIKLEVYGSRGLLYCQSRVVWRTSQFEGIVS